MAADSEFVDFLRRIEDRKTARESEKVQLKLEEKHHREREAKKASHRVCIGIAALLLTSFNLCLNTFGLLLHVLTSVHLLSR